MVPSIHTLSMSTALLDNLTTEVEALNEAGTTTFSDIAGESQDFLNELKLIESSLEEQLRSEESLESVSDTFDVKLLENCTDTWYKKSISSLKGYNSQINKFLKNILNNSRYNIDLDESYTYPLNLHNYPIKDPKKNPTTGEVLEGTIEYIKGENQMELLKAIILHLLKIGQCDIVRELVKEMFPNDEVVIENELLAKFKLLNEIVDDITIRHDLTRVLQWFKDKYNKNVALSSGISQLNASPLSNYDEIEFKFHILQFILLLNGDKDNPSTTSLESAAEAYMYSKEYFPRFSKEYIHELSPLMTLLLFKTDRDSDDDFAKKHVFSLLTDLANKMKQTYDLYKEKKKDRASESQFLGELLANFQNIHLQQHLFINLSNEFISEYCKDMKLSNDSSLFQAMLAGFINLPNFQKYSLLQKKLGKTSKASVSLDSAARPDINPGNNNPPTNRATSDSNIKRVNVEAPYNFDLPFLLPDSNRFLFKYHPIFICPVSKEQLIPLTTNSSSLSEAEHKRKKKKKGSNDPDPLNFVYNPVVVLEHCQHLALRDSIWQLSKRGADNFKCHYCYKKHQFSDVSDGYFIDL